MKSVLLLCLLVSSALFAQQPPDSSQPADPATVAKAAETIVVTASALPESLESTPATVTVITRKQIEEHSASDVADLLREVPGVTVSRTGSPGRDTSLFTRGSNSTHTLVLWNGIELNNPYFAGYDWGRFSTAGVEQVEVVRGPFSSLYGSDAVAGVVNVLTNPVRNAFNAVVEAGGNGLRNVQAGGAYVNARNVVSGALERRTDDGFARNDDFAQTSANLLWRWTNEAHLSAGVAARYTSYDLGIPTNLNAAGTALIASPARRESGNERQIAIPFSQTLGGFQYDVALSESHRIDRFSDPDDPYGYVDSSTSSTSRRARLTTRTSVGTLGTLVAGGEYSRAEVTDLSNFGPNLDHDRRSSKSIFAEERFSHAVGTAARLEVSAGARYDSFDTIGSQTSPRAAAALIIGANKFRAGFGAAFRAPSIGELYFPFSGNRDLRPERSRSAELGYDRTFATGELSATLFRGSYRNLIVFDNATYLFGNVGRATTRGIELSGTHNIGNAYGSVTYTYLDNPLPRRPRNSGSLFAGYRTGPVDANIAVVRSGRRDDVLPVFPFSTIADRPYTTVDINVQVHSGGMTPYVKVENATGVRYEEVRGYPSPSRRAIVGIRFAM